MLVKDYFSSEAGEVELTHCLPCPLLALSWAHAGTDPQPSDGHHIHGEYFLPTVSVVNK